MTALTAKQAELRDFIAKYQTTKGTTPTFDEMRDALGLRSKSGVHRLVLGLEERGYIKRLPNRARAIEIVPKPHLPASLSAFPTSALAREARRRGLVLGEYHRSTVRSGEKSKEIRRFIEVAA